MKPRDLTDLALRNLRESLLRNALTTLGVAVGVASLVAMLSLGVGLQQLAAKRLSQSGLFDTILVTPKNAFRGMGRPQREPESDKPPRILDDDVRKEMERLPNVIEVYPQVRFFTEVRFNNKPFATVVAGMPDSSRNSGSFDGMQGNFFSSTTAKEAILQIEFAKDLSDKPSSLIGQELVLRYAERQSLPSAAANTDPSANSPDTSGGGFSVVPKELRLKIVGIVETEPAAGYGGYGNARLLMPLATASTLRAAQVNDLRDIVPDSNAGKTTYASLSVRAKSPSQVEALETSIKKMGLNAFSLLDASKSLRTFFTVFDSLLGIFGCLALAVATLGIVNTLVMAILERRFGCPTALLCRGRRDGLFRRRFRRTLRLAPRPRRHLRHQRLSPAPESQSHRTLFRPPLARLQRPRFRHPCQSRRRPLSCFSCRQAQPRRRPPL